MSVSQRSTRRKKERLTDLRQLRRVSKRIRKNEGIADLPKLLLEVPLAVEELTAEGFSGGEVGVHFDW